MLSKLCLNLCLPKWLKPNRNLVSSLNATHSSVIEDFILGRSNKFIRTFLKLR